MAKKKKKNNSIDAERKSAKRFKKGLRIYLLFLTLVVAGALAVLWYFLDNYQIKQDAIALENAQLAEQQAHEKAVRQAPQRCFEEFMNGIDAQYWCDVWFSSHPDSLDVPEKVLAHFETLFNGENAVRYKASSYQDSAPVYVLKNGEMELAEISLAGSELNWAVQEVTLSIEATESASIEVPTGCTVYCNGTKLDPATASDPHTYFEMAELEGSLQNPIQWSTYTVEGLLFPPELTAESPADKTLITDENGNMNYVLSADAAAPYQKQGEEMIKALLYYYMQGGSNTAANMNAVLKHLVNGSPAYKLVNESYNGVTWDATYPNATYQAEALDVIIWADNCMSMDVKYHSEGTKGGYTNVADGTYRLFFMDNGNGFGICGLSY